MNIEFSKHFNVPTSFLDPNALANRFYLNLILYYELNILSSFTYISSYFNYERLESISRFLETKTNIKPLVGIICGSGLGNIGELIENKTILNYDDIPDFPRSTGKIMTSVE